MKIKPAFSIIIPTLGRPSLTATLNSIDGAGAFSNDQVIIVTDGKIPSVPALVGNSSLCSILKPTIIEGPETHAWGNAQRNKGIEALEPGNYVLFMDDDDQYLPGVFDMVNEQITYHPHSILLFKTFVREDGIIWKTKEIKHGNIGTQNVVFPPKAITTQRWGIPRGDQHCSDYHFILDVASTGIPVEYIDYVITDEIIFSWGKFEKKL